MTDPEAADLRRSALRPNRCSSAAPSAPCLLLNGLWFVTLYFPCKLLSVCVWSPALTALTDLLAGEDKSTRFLYSNFLAEKFKLEAPYKQYGLYLSCGAGLFLLGRNFSRASQLLEVQACTDPAKKLELQELGKFYDADVKYAARQAARFRIRGIAAGVGVPILWLAWRFAIHDGSSGSLRSKGRLHADE